MDRVRVVFFEALGLGIGVRSFHCPKCDSYIDGGEERSTLAAWGPSLDVTRTIQCRCGATATYVHATFTPIFIHPETKAEVRLPLPAGACFDGDWYHGHRTGPDGRRLVVVLPNGHHWHLDSRCSNCTLPEDKEHRCWVRHGRPEDGTLHVDKDGLTCSAGAGSIQSGDYHGFLHNGHLESA